MSEQQRAHISALADGELDSGLVNPIIDALESNDQLRATWERYSLIGSALRGGAMISECRGIAARVRDQLQTEPVPITHGLTPHSRVKQIKRSGPLAGHRGASSRSGYYAGLALAASAAFLTVFGVPQLFAPDAEAPTRTGLAKLVTPAATPVGVGIRSPILARETTDNPPLSSAPLANEFRPRWHLTEPRLESKLDRFLVNHQVSASANGIKGIFPYAMVVGYEAGR